MHQNETFTLAADFVNYTNESLFLTGKAGTGKTTFLHHIKSTSKKKLAIAAPTGIAAINAGGVTLHSLLHLPLGIYLPIPQAPFTSTTYSDKNTVLRSLRMNNQKKELLRELQLLIIDEVSMLRADMLDCMDMILQYVRGIREPFGGLQVLFIGDLYQLPPAVRDNEQTILAEYYKSPYFFDALVMQNYPLVKIELSTIYRQTDSEFIELLNNIRHNQLTAEDYELLKTREKIGYTNVDNDIILTTHNAKAETINNDKLHNTPGASSVFVGEVEKDFPEHNLPVEKELALKPQAQVMLVRNHAAGLFYNGSLATVTKIEDKKIYLRLKDNGAEIELEKEKWKTIRYVLNNDNKIAEEETGSYTQYPLRLAWAVTIHKSQGLTFNKIVVDAGKSFAAGQVYVALSRCTSLQGITLLSSITPFALHSNKNVVQYSESGWASTQKLQQKLIPAKRAYEQALLEQSFMVRSFFNAINIWIEQTEQRVLGNAELYYQTIKNIQETLNHLEQVGQKFSLELGQLTNNYIINNQSEPLINRIEKAIAYFTNMLQQQVQQPLEAYIKKVKPLKNSKPHVAEASQALQKIQSNMLDWGQLKYDDLSFASPKLPQTTIVDTAIETKPKKIVGETKLITLAMFKDGNTVLQIAEQRQMVQATILGHLADAVKNGELNAAQILPKQIIDGITHYKDVFKTKSLSEIRSLLNNTVSYGELKIMAAEWGFDFK
jgi:hypothetical protein